MAAKVEAAPERSAVTGTNEAPANKGRARGVALGVLGAFAIAIGGWYVLHAGLEETDDAQVDADVVAVPARIGGVVQSVRFIDNQTVKAGDLLAEIDPQTAQAKLAEAEAELASAKAAADAAEAETKVIDASAHGQKSVAEASLAGASIGATASADEIAQADAQVTSATVARQQASTDLERVKKLVATNALPQQELERAQSTFDAAEANLAQARAHQAVVRSSTAQARARILEAKARLGQSSAVDAQVAQAEARAAAARARVATAQAARDLAALDVGYTKIVAPRDGVVSKKAITVGQMIAAGQAIVMLVPTRDVWVTANYKETQLAKMHVGQPAEVEVDAYPGLKLHGEVESFSAATGAKFSLLPPDNATGNFTKVVQRVPVRIKLKDLPGDRPLRPGMSVVATVDARAHG